MRNLFQFFLRYNSFFIFLVLEVVCLTLVIRQHSYHKATFLNSTTFISGNIYQSYNRFIEYLHLTAINDSLVRENALLRMQEQNALQQPLSEVEVCEGDTQLLYTYIPAKVINNSTNKINNYLTLNKGKEDGIVREMGVVGLHGVVGIVRNVSDHFASVMSVLHKNTRISVKIKRLNYLGSLQWNGGSPKKAQVTGIPQYLNIAKGDTIITSGYSAIFPEGILVGTISDFSEVKGSNFYEINVGLATNFETIRYTYVVDYSLKEEQLELESKHD